MIKTKEMIVLAIVVATAYMWTVYTAEEEYVGIITDIEQVSAGSSGFLSYSPSRCILYINGVKQNKKGKWCDWQIGNMICKYSSTFSLIPYEDVNVCGEDKLLG